MYTKSCVTTLTILMGLATTHSSMAAVVDAVEYYYSGHYFLTAFQDEISAIDTGAIPGWKRRGYTFKVQSGLLSNYSPVCRFYSVGVSRGSHFYTTFADECAWLKTEANWKYEGTAFYAQSAGTDGSCLAGKVPVYRLYNNLLSGAPNHRFTTDATVRAEMIAKGWAAEGVAFCAESSSSSPIDPGLAQQTAKMVGGTWTFSYTLNGSQNSDVLSFKTVVGDPLSVGSPYYAQGTNQYGLPATARYNTQTAQMEIRSSFLLPATDYYSMPFNGGSVMAGCYYFLPTNEFTPSGSCTKVVGTRR